MNMDSQDVNVYEWRKHPLRWTRYSLAFVLLATGFWVGLAALVIGAVLVMSYDIEQTPGLTGFVLWLVGFFVALNLGVPMMGVRQELRWERQWMAYQERG